MKRFPTLLLLVATAAAAAACGPFWRSYLAEDHYLFRLCGDDMTGYAMDGQRHIDSLRRADNCNAWRRITSAALPLADVEEVVYRWPADRLHALHAAASGTAPLAAPLSDNAFARWLAGRRDVEVTQYLLLAKECETVRQSQNSAWYYPVAGDEASMALDSIAARALRYSGRRLADRYCLQAMRALFAGRRYDDCLNVWLACRADLPQGEVRRMAVGYAAGAYLRAGEVERAKRMFLDVGDYDSYYFCCQQVQEDEPVPLYERIRRLYEASPDDAMLPRLVQREVHDIERSGWPTDTLRRIRMYDLAVRACREQRCRQMAPWHYTRAFLADEMGRADEAWQSIEAARTATGSRALQDEIRVLRLYLAAKRAKCYTPEFEQFLYDELRWLDGRMAAGLTPALRSRIMEKGFSSHICGYSLYYWSDMMRKVVIGQVVPLCLRSRYQTRALQYLNMADNSLFHLVDSVSFSYYLDQDDDWGYRDTLLSVDAYRHSGFINDYDYCNDFFINLDSIGVDYVVRLADRMQHPSSPLDRFLNARSYADPQYLYDIIGTQYTAQMRYADAVRYLSRLSDAFVRSRNVSAYADIDPFGGQAAARPVTDFRLAFAQRMQGLASAIDTLASPDARADSLLVYARGLLGSVGQGWALTSFYRGVFPGMPYNSRYQRRMSAAIMARAQAIVPQAIGLYTDPERAARACCDWHLYKTAATRFPATQTAIHVRTHCDELRDYSPSSYEFPVQNLAPPAGIRPASPMTAAGARAARPHPRRTLPEHLLFMRAARPRSGNDFLHPPPGN